MLIEFYESHIADKAFAKQLSIAHDLFLHGKHLLLFTGYPVNLSEEFCPFFIVGSGRSGNTLLRRILCSNPEIHIPPETYRLGPAIKLYRQNNTLDWKTLVHLVLSEFEYQSQFDTFGISLRPLALELVDAPKSSRSLAFILDKFYRHHAQSVQKGNCVRWGDKTPINVFWLETICAVFPNAQYINIVRDGCDVAVSYLKSGLAANIETSAKRWLFSVRAGMNFVSRHREKSINIRYEDLVTYPAKTTKIICDFLGLEFEEEMIHSEKITHSMGDVIMLNHHKHVSEPISTTSIGKGRNQLSLDERKMLDSIIGSQLVSLGYERCL